MRKARRYTSVHTYALKLQIKVYYSELIIIKEIRMVKVAKSGF
jgi:hypothetical protein